MAAAPQKPLELILARNLLSSLSTPALLVNRPGDIAFTLQVVRLLAENRGRFPPASRKFKRTRWKRVCNSLGRQ